jgi:hypothetical protein
MTTIRLLPAYPLKREKGWLHLLPPIEAYRIVVSGELYQACLIFGAPFSLHVSQKGSQYVLSMFHQSLYHKIHHSFTDLALNINFLFDTHQR